MSSLVPATVGFSLARLARHGGADGPHKDGWGVAFYEGGDVSLLRESRAAHDSAFMQFVERQNARSCLVISHIRLATRGNRALRNTQPFSRELGGRMHVFAHNGDLPGIDDSALNCCSGSFRPIGDSDSELAFCALLSRLEPLWLGAADRSVPGLAERYRVVGEVAREMARMGPANFIYADGDVLFVHAHQRTQSDGVIRAPGLHLLQRACWTPNPALADAGVHMESVRQDVAIVASVPLTDELWQPLAEGELLVLRDGKRIAPDGQQPPSDCIHAGTAAALSE